VSRASVNINYFQQDGESVVSNTFRTHDAINALTGGEPGTRPPNNLKLVMLSYCDAPEYEKALAVWDTDTEGLTGSSLCLWTESQTIYDSSMNRFYQGLDIETGPFNLSEVDMDVQVNLGSVPRRINPDEPLCLRSFRTLSMAGYASGEGDSVVLKGNGRISTSGPVKATLEGNAVGCD
jgi:hypothetical protein